MTITFALEMALSFHDGMMNTYPKEVVVTFPAGRGRATEQSLKFRSSLKVSTKCV